MRIIEELMEIWPNEVCDKVERMLLQKLYNHTMDFIKSTKLFKPANVYSLSLAERNSLNT